MKNLFIDIETAPNLVYSWGLWDQNIAINQIVDPGYTLCWAAKWGDSKSILFSSIFDDGKDAMLNGAAALLNEADVVTHYNGKSFDIPVLNKEFLENKIARPSPYKQVDLLHVMRKNFRFPSNKLSYISRALNLGDKLQHKGMDLWKECMAGDPKAWKVMEKYNVKDVKLLEQLYYEVLPWIDGHPNVALYGNADAPSCPNCGSHSLERRGFYTANTQRYQRYRCRDCGSWSRTRFTEVAKEERVNILAGAR